MEIIQITPKKQMISFIRIISFIQVIQINENIIMLNNVNN